MGSLFAEVDPVLNRWPVIVIPAHLMTKDTWDEILVRLSVNLFLRGQKVAPGTAIQLELARRLESPGLHLARHTYPADLRQPSTRESVSPLFLGCRAEEAGFCRQQACAFASAAVTLLLEMACGWRSLDKEPTGSSTSRACLASRPLGLACNLACNLASPLVYGDCACR